MPFPFLRPVPGDGTQAVPYKKKETRPRCFEMQKRNIPKGMFLFWCRRPDRGNQGAAAVEPSAGGCPPDIRIFNRSSPAALRCRKGIPFPGYPFSGAADRTRTGTELPPADFKSAVSTIPPQRRGLPNHFSIVSDCRQVGRTALPPPIRSGDCPGWLSWLVGGVGDPALQRNQNNSLHLSSAEAMTASIS